MPLTHAITRQNVNSLIILDRELDPKGAWPRPPGHVIVLVMSKLLFSFNLKFRGSYEQVMDMLNTERALEKSCHPVRLAILCYYTNSSSNLT